MTAPMPSTQQTADLLAAVLADLAQVVGGVTADHLHDPTPCADWDVAQLRDHVLGWLTTFAAGFADPDGQAPRASLDGYTAPADPAAEVRSAAATLDAALRSGAASRPLRLGEAAMPGGMALDMILWEYLVHGWDLARATGQPWSPPAAATAESLAFAPGLLTADYQGHGKAFGVAVPVPDTAPPLDRLLGLSGRDPRWPAAAHEAEPARTAADTDGPLVARFTVDAAEPAQIAGLPADWLGLMIFRKTFTAGITGEATTVFMAAGPQEGSRSYVATERITGRAPDGREGAVTIQHGGLESDPDAWFGQIVPHSGTGGFEGWTGPARICHDDEGAYFEIRLG
jgi:uncharacterized protein (TIGR03086 family)